jgi:neutral ceramidase
MSFVAALILLAPARFTLRQSQVALDPPEALPLGGYTARQGQPSEPGGETLYARVAILSQGEKSVVFVSLEMLTVPESLVAKVREKLPPGLNLFMVATHTHSAPDSQMLNSRMTMGVPGIATYKEKWLNWYADRIAGAIIAARSAGAGGVELETAEFKPGLNRSRRPYGAPDPWVHIVEAANKPMLTVYAAHGTIYDEHRNQTSGDWPGEIMRENGGLVFPGAIGDISPAPGNDKGTGGEKIKQFAQTWSRTYRHAVPDKLSGGLSLTAEPIDLGEPFLHPDFARANGVPEVLAKRLLTTFAPREAAITAVRLGDVVLLGVPGEPTSHVGRRITEYGRQRGLRIWVISHCNGWMGYIVDPADYLLNGYEATLTMYGPGTANRVVDAANRAIERLSG